MANNSDLPRLSRLTAILILLQSKRMITAQDIASKFDISKRTAYRDIKALEMSGVPIFTVEGKGYSLMQNYTLPPVMFTEEEANALITAEQLISKNKDKSLVENHQNALLKLKSVMNLSQQDKVQLLSDRVVFMNNFAKETSSNSLSRIQLAITNLQLIKINYLSLGKAEKTERFLEPQALYHTRGNWIMIAWCRLRDDYREFRLDQIQNFHITTESFESRNFSLMGYFQKMIDAAKLV